MKELDIKNNPKFQSAQIRLEATGSTGRDNTIMGHHLRWDFRNNLGENHIARGKLKEEFPSIIPIHNENDSVNIYKTVFRKEFLTEIDFSRHPEVENNKGNTREWIYSICVEGLEDTRHNVIISFHNTSIYDQIRASQGELKPTELINQYPDVIEVFFEEDLLFFYYEFTGKFDPGGMIRCESISTFNSNKPLDKAISSRNKINQNGIENFSENTKSIRFDCHNSSPLKLVIITYQDFTIGVTMSEKEGWSHVNDFGLTLEDGIAHERLLGDIIDNNWPKYIIGDNGEYTVSVTNYMNRWKSDEGVRKLIESYLKLSAHDPKAIMELPSNDSKENTIQVVSCLDLLQLLSLDYHVARMLGLGHIENEIEDEGRYIYAMQYKTYCDYENNITQNSDEVTHLYLSLPTSTSDERLPQIPDLDDITFGATINNGTNKPTELTDDKGYVKFGDTRFININRDVNDFEIPFGTFFQNQKEFSLSSQTQPIAYGVKYKSDSEAKYRIPELNHDKIYFDNKNIAETIPLLNTGLKLFSHQETEEGTHDYAAYSINWFARASAITGEKSVTTEFPKKSYLLPPFNLHTQLIQDEDPTEDDVDTKTLILTTPTEQTLLQKHNKINDDSIFLRVNFDWNHVHHNAHQYADYAELLFRKNDPLTVKGKITSVQDIGNDRVTITTESYMNYSKSVPGEIIQPTITASQKERFIGSLLSTGGNNYKIVEIIANGNNPSFTIEKIKTTEPFPNPEKQNQFISHETFEEPNLGDLFFIIENLGNIDNWDLRHTKKVYLEKFYSNSKIQILNSSSNAIKEFNIDNAVIVGGNTEIYVAEEIKFPTINNLSVRYFVKYSIKSIKSGLIEVSGDHTADFGVTHFFRIFGSKNNDGEYTIANVYFSSNITTIELIVGESFPDVETDSSLTGFIQILSEKSLHGIDTTNNSFIVSGEIVNELNIANVSYKTETDGTKTRFVNGGITDTVTFAEVKDKRGYSSGYLEVKFDNFNLENHSDPDVIWDKGIIRLSDNNGETRPYNVSLIGDYKGNKTNPLTLIIQDPDFISSGSGGTYSLDISSQNNANYHPSYKLYLKEDNGVDSSGNAIPTSGIHFDETNILPSLTNFAEGNRKTYLAVRAIDVKESFESFIAPPVVIISQRVTMPLAPGAPVGPKYATRPNFYGKSTYTFDVKVNTENRVPYSVVFYRGSADLILSALYKKSTIDQIWSNLNNLPYSDAKYDQGLWDILLKVTNSGANFAERLTTEYKYTWPKPDNENYFVPFDSNVEITDSNIDEIMPDGYKYPFAGSFGLNSTYTIYGESVTGIEIVKKAILSAFLPLNEQPPVYSYIKTGKQTSSEKSISRDTNGNLLDPSTNDLFPMIKKYVDGGKTYLRFTDYSIDGASSSMYFYLAMEMSDKLKFSLPSPAIGPVLTVNSSAVDKPQIRSAKTQLQDSIMDINAAIILEINSYLPSDNVSKIKLYRAANNEDALSIRTMQHIKTFDLADEIIDDFANDANPLYGEDLNYRIVAVKEIQEIEDVINSSSPQTVEIESLPSDTVKISLVDSVNPDAPEILSSNTVTSGTVPKDNLSNVVLKWSPTCYNGKYRLQKMNSMGNWADVYFVSSKSEPMQYPPLDSSQNPDFTNFSETALLARKDSNGNKIYHRYRVVVESSSGLFNSYQNEITLATGLNDLARINEFFSFEDNSQLHSLDTLQSIAFNEGSCSPDVMKFKFLEFELPAGHNAVLSIAVTLKDDLGNESTKTKSNPSFNAEISFNSADGIQLDSSNPNRIYTVTTSITSDYVDIDNNVIATFEQVFILDYLNGRYNNLWTRRLDMLPIVTESAIVTVKDKLIVIGGTDGTNDINNVREYDFSTNEIIKKNDWENRVQCLAVEFTDKAYIIGGYQGAPTNIISELTKYDPASDEWNVVNNMPFNARLNAIFVNYEDKFYYGLGEDESGNVMSDWWEYDIVNNIWTGKNDAPTPITQASYFVLHDGIYVIGGKTDNGETFDCWRYDINSGNWVQIASLPNPNNKNGLYQSAGFSNDDSYGYVCGGANSATVFSQDVWRYCIQNDEWCKVSDFNGDAARIQSSVVVIENSAYIIGGYNQDGTVCEEIWEFNF